jgi:alpha-beta hydrolase superfamily lysophospholipase
MGSFVTRCYIARHGEGLAGAIVMGTGWQPGAALGAGKFLANVIALFHGWDYYSRMIDNIGVGGYNKAFEGTGAKTGVEWLSRDPQRTLDYVADPDSGWHFPVSGYYVLFSLLQEAEDPKAIAKIPKDLPVFVISGGDDPVGEQGKGPTLEFNALKDAGVRDVELQLYDGARHEILGETNKAEVMADIVDWIDRHALVR